MLAGSEASPDGAAQPKRNFFALVAHTFATVFAGAAAQIVAGIVTARAFGPPGKGILSYAAMFALFGVASAQGLNSAIAFQFGNERLPLKVVWSAAMRVLAVLAPAGTAVFVGLWLHDKSQTAYLFVAFVFPFASFLQTVNMVYLVRHAIKRINVQNAATVGAGSSIVTTLAVLVFHARLVDVLSIWAAGYVAAALWAAAGLSDLLPPRGQDGERRASRSVLAEQATFSIKGGLSSIVTLLAVRIDVIIVASSLTKTALGVYTVALAVAEMLNLFTRSLTYATQGHIATEPRAAAVALTSKVIRLLLIGQTAAALVVFAAGPYAIDLLYGARFAGAGLLLRIILARTVVYSVDGVVSYFITVRAGRPGVQFAFELGTLVLCAASTSVAVHMSGLTGAALAATATFVVAFAVKLAYYVRVAQVPLHEVLRPRLDDLPESLRLRMSAILPAAR